MIDRLTSVARLLDEVSQHSDIDALAEARCLLQDVIDDAREPENKGVTLFNPYVATEQSTQMLTTVERIKDMLKELSREEVTEVETSARAALVESEPTEYDAHMIELAYDQYHNDGEIEIDQHSAVVSASDEGAYVMAWVWVYGDKRECDNCGEEFDAGDECDGLCPSCSEESDDA